MKKRLKGLLALTLALCMVLGMTTRMAAAADTHYIYTDPSDPNEVKYQISTDSDRPTYLLPNDIIEPQSSGGFLVVKLLGNNATNYEFVAENDWSDAYVAFDDEGETKSNTQLAANKAYSDLSAAEQDSTGKSPIKVGDNYSVPSAADGYGYAAVAQPETNWRHYSLDFPTGWTDDDGVWYYSLITANVRMVTLTYAPIPYTINYDYDGGKLLKGKTNPSTYTIESSDITLNNPVKDWYEFAGWTGGKVVEVENYDGSTTTTVSDEAKNGKSVVIKKGSTGNREYTAHWKPVDYTIKYDLNGGIGTTPSADELNVGDKDYELPNGDSFTNNGSDFIGWSIAADEIDDILKNGDAAVKHMLDNFNNTGENTITLYAQYEPATVTFHSNDGTDKKVIQQVQAGSDAELNANEFTREGYTFKEWNTQKDGSGDSYEDKATVPANAFTETGELTLYAIWEDATEPTEPPTSTELPAQTEPPTTASADADGTAGTDKADKGDKTEKAEKPENDDATGTGDGFSIMPWLILATVAAIGAVAITSRKRTER